MLVYCIFGICIFFGFIALIGVIIENLREKESLVSISMVLFGCVLFVLLGMSSCVSGCSKNSDWNSYAKMKALKINIEVYKVTNVDIGGL